MQAVRSNIHSGSLAHILQTFSISLLIAFVGMLCGNFIPPAAITVCLVVELVMLLSTIVIRLMKKNIGYPFLFIFTFISGITLFPIISYYGSTIGANMVTTALLITTVIFGSLAFYANKTQRNFSFLGGFLMAATIGLILISIVAIFINFGPFVNLIWAMGGILIFSGWVLYDISQYKHGVAPEEVPFAALRLYLDFINLFLYILKLINAITGNR